MKNAALNRKLDAGNSHVRFDEGEVASYLPTEGIATGGAKSKRGSLFYKNLLAAVFCSLVCGSVLANTEVTWRGGPSGDFYNAENWDPQIVPSDQNLTAYVAVFTNTVTTTGTSETYWFTGGVKVRNGATVSLTFPGQRIMPTKKADGNRIVFDVAEGSSLSVSATIIYGRGNCTFEKTGSGSCTFPGTVSLSTDDKYYKDIVISGGYFETKQIYATNSVSVTGTAELKITNPNGIAGFGTYLPSLSVESGATVVFNNYDQNLAALSGGGTVSGMKSMTLNLQQSGLTFSGSIVGSLIVTPVVGVTPEGATWVVGAQNTLVEADLQVNEVEGSSAEVLFAPNIGVFVAKSYPSRTFYDTDGQPVQLCSQIVYVDSRRSGDDAGDGKSWGTAFKTLAAAMMSEPKEYATVLVRPGRYDSGEMSPVVGEGTSNRVVIAKNVAVISTGSAADTFIIGAASSEVPGAKCDGCGPASVRCAYLKYGASLRGFTLTDGHARMTTTSAGDVGGGIRAENTNGQLVDCVISNNVAYRGNVVGCSLVRCHVLNNRTTAGLGGGVLYGCIAYDTLFDGNGGSSAHYVANNEAKFVNCTFGPNETANILCGSTKFTSVYNTLFLSPINGNADCVKLYQSMALAGSQTSVVADGRSVVTNIANVAERFAYAGLGVDLKPLPGSRLVDTGNAAHRASPEVSTSDAFGGQRVFNRNIDIGGVEYDWRGGFAKALAQSSRFAVLTATPNVTTNVAGGLLLSGGDVLTAQWTNPRAVPRDYSFVVSISGTGTLTCSYGGQTRKVTADDDVVTLEWSGDLTEENLKFDFVGDGNAVLSSSSSKGTLGLLMLLR